MIHPIVKELLLKESDKLLTPASKVSMIFNDNSLLHAVMILNNTTYTKIPVLDYENRFRGLISTQKIIQYVGDKIYEGFDILNNFKVEEALDGNFYSVNEGTDLEDVLNALVDHNFVVVVDSEGVFKGIITRSAILKRVNYLVHELELDYIISRKL